jgi:hypothetical protein
MPYLMPFVRQMFRMLHSAQGPAFSDLLPTNGIMITTIIVVICGVVGRASTFVCGDVGSIPTCGTLEVWPWTFGSRTMWLANKSVEIPSFIVEKIANTNHWILMQADYEKKQPILPKKSLVHRDCQQ